MGNHQHAALCVAQHIHPFRDDFERIDIKPGIGFIKHRQLRFKQRHLQDFIAFLLATRKPDIHRTLKHLIINAQILGFRPHHFDKFKLVDFVFALIKPAGIHRRPQKAHAGHTRQFNRVLKGQKHASTGALIGFHFKNRLTIQQHITTGDFIPVTS